MALSPDDWCTRKEAAGYLHVSVQTITRYCHAGRLTWRRIEGARGIRIRTDSVSRMLDWDYAS